MRRLAFVHGAVSDIFAEHALKKLLNSTRDATDRKRRGARCMSMVFWWQLVWNGRLKKLRRIFGTHIVELILEERKTMRVSGTPFTPTERKVGKVE
jgi:hypothetical protein